MSRTIQLFSEEGVLPDDHICMYSVNTKPCETKQTPVLEFPRQRLFSSLSDLSINVH